MVLLPLAAALVVGLTVYAVLDCIRANPAQIALMPKPVWLALIVLIPVLGPAGWLVSVRYAARRVLAPDDDDRFLASLNADRRRRDGSN